MREQHMVSSQDPQISTSSFTSHTDLHNIFLSANVMPKIQLHHEFLNLQRIELATCGLQALPDTFGLSVPNVRVLNLNSNAIKDLRPLLNTKRLTHLYVTGNRLARLRRNLAVLAKLTTLTKIDLRDNPFTVGFYPVATEKRIVPLNEERFNESDDFEPYTLPDQDSEAEELYSSRLDDDTRLRKRVYQIMLATSCPKLDHLDGLKFSQDNALIRDDIWDRLALLGVLKKSAQQEAS
jgi:protein NUD1